MKWVSTRGASPAVPFIDALFAGTAPDGGLYMPERLEPLPPGTVDALRGSGVVEIATRVGAHLLRDEITADALRPLVTEAAKSSDQAPTQGNAPEGSRLLPVRVVASASKTRTAVVVRAAADDLLELALPSGVRVRFPAGTDLSYLRALAAAL